LTIIDWILHVDRAVAVIFHDWGWVAWALIFFIVFVETGVVIFPFLPGDSLLFACGAFAAAQNEPLWLFFVVLAAAALLGNTANYSIGRRFGSFLLRDRPGKRPWIKPAHLEETHQFFERWGGWAVTISRFFPILRTITPFVAGVGRMTFRSFTGYNALGGLGWTAVFLAAGYFFGTLPWIQHNFSLVVLALVLIPAIPAAVGFIKTLRQRKK